MWYIDLSVSRIGTADDRYSNNGEDFGNQVPLQWNIAVHPNQSGRIAINYPGVGGSIDGYADKYLKLANLIQEKNIAAVVRTGNHPWAGFQYEKSLVDDLRTVIDYSLEASKDICGSKEPELYLMGFSAGASAVAAIAHEFEKVSRILLLAPSGDAGDSIVNLGKYKGDVYITVGENDEIVGQEAGLFFYDMATGAKSRKLVIVPNCDHQFRGEINGMIMSKAPLWAFAGDKTFPNPECGIKLYD
ncbi:MAG: hypothetical protein V1900_02965 [Candidatus Aenigmatarchaeota archaeon]